METKKEVEQRHLAEELRKQKIGPKKRRIILKEFQEEQKRKENMKLSIKEGSFASIMTGLYDAYIIPFALALNATSLHVGLLRSFSGLFPPISQLYGSKLMETQSRKKTIMKYVALQALMILPVLLLALLFWKNLFSDYLPHVLILFYTLYAIFGSIAGPSWFSLMGDVVPEKIRGKYFGKRNRITGAVALMSTLVAAFLLDFFKTRGAVLIGFSIIFFIASIARLNSARLFKKHSEHQLNLKKGYYFSFTNFLRGIKKYNFNKFSLFVALMHLSTMIAAPFFTVYMLEELNFNYTTFMMVTLAAAFSSLVVMSIWGKFSDKYGRKETIIISSILIAIMPIFWLFSSSPYYLLIPMIIGGVGAAGFNLSAFNFIYDSVSPERRGICVAYHNILMGIGIFIGSAVGGLILQNIDFLKLNINKFFIIFVFSSVLRAATSIIFLPKIKEIRKVRKFHPVIVFKKMAIHSGLISVPVHNIHITKNNKKKN